MIVHELVYSEDGSAHYEYIVLDDRVNVDALAADYFPMTARSLETFLSFVERLARDYGGTRCQAMVNQTFHKPR